MSKEKGLKISWRVFLAGMFILTVLFFLDIKFVVLGINILVLDMLTAGIWAFVRLCRWAGRENTEKRTIAVIAIILMGLFAAPVLLFGLGLEGGWYEYAEGTEPQTHRTFVVEYRRNMLQRGQQRYMSGSVRCYSPAVCRNTAGIWLLMNWTQNMQVFTSARNNKQLPYPFHLWAKVSYPFKIAGRDGKDTGTSADRTAR